MLLRAGLAVPPALLVAACGVRAEDDQPTAGATTPEAGGPRLRADPLCRFVVGAAIDAFGDDDSTVLRSGDFPPELLSLGAALTESIKAKPSGLWGAVLSRAPMETMAVAWWYDDTGRLRGSAARGGDYGSVVVPLVVQLGIFEHASHIAKVRVDTNWNGWSRLRVAERRSWLRDELAVGDCELRDGTENLTERSVYRCVLSGDRDEKQNSFMEFQWNPTTSRTEQTSLSIDRGQALVNQPELWAPDYHQVVGIRTDDLWSDVTPASTTDGSH